jgi:hypothetical protein
MDAAGPEIMRMPLVNHKYTRRESEEKRNYWDTHRWAIRYLGRSEKRRRDQLGQHLKAPLPNRVGIKQTNSVAFSPQANYTD